MGYQSKMRSGWYEQKEFQSMLKASENFNILDDIVIEEECELEEYEEEDKTVDL